MLLSEIKFGQIVQRPHAIIEYRVFPIHKHLAALEYYRECRNCNVINRREGLKTILRAKTSPTRILVRNEVIL